MISNPSYSTFDIESPARALAGAAAAKKHVRDYSAILSGYSWTGPPTLQKLAEPVFLTFSFPKSMPRHDYVHSRKGWQRFTEGDKKDARAALKQWSDASGITFIETSGSSQTDLEFTWLPTSGASQAFAYRPLSYSPYVDSPDDISYYYEYAGSVYLNTEYKTYFKQDPKFKKYTLLHEIGHALGLKHPFEVEKLNKHILAKKIDSTKYTVMSYNYETHKLHGTKLGIFDKQAIASLYGRPGSQGTQVLSYHWDKSTQTLTQTGFETAESMRGTAIKDVLNGSGGDDRLLGFTGDDVLIGGEGRDTLIGGKGHDTFVFTAMPGDKNADVIKDFGGADDTLKLSRSAFSAISETGVLHEASFRNGRMADKAEQRIIYDDGNGGSLYYDPDGSGPIAQIKFAEIGNYSGLTAAHILLI